MLSQLARAGRRPAGTLTHPSRRIPSENPAQRLEVKSRAGGSSKVREGGRSRALRAGGRQRAWPRVGAEGAGKTPTDASRWRPPAGRALAPSPAGGARGRCPGKPRPPLPHCHIPQRVSSAVLRPRAFYGQTTLPGRGFFRELGGSAGLGSSSASRCCCCSRRAGRGSRGVRPRQPQRRGWHFPLPQR